MHALGLLLAAVFAVNEPLQEGLWEVVCGGKVDAILAFSSAGDGFKSSSGTEAWNGLKGMMDTNGANMTLMKDGQEAIDAWFETFPSVIASDSCTLTLGKVNCSAMIRTINDSLVATVAFKDELTFTITSPTGFRTNLWFGFSTTPESLQGRDIIGVSFLDPGIFIRDGWGAVQGNTLTSVSDVTNGGSNSITQINTSVSTEISFQRGFDTGDARDTPYQDGAKLTWFLGTVDSDNFVTIMESSFFNITMIASCQTLPPPPSEPFFSLTMILILTGSFLGFILISLIIFYLCMTCSRPLTHFSEFSLGAGEVDFQEEQKLGLTALEVSNSVTI